MATREEKMKVIEQTIDELADEAESFGQYRERTHEDYYSNPKEDVYALKDKLIELIKELVYEAGMR